MQGYALFKAAAPAILSAPDLLAELAGTCASGRVQPECAELSCDRGVGRLSLAVGYEHEPEQRRVGLFPHTPL